MRPQKTRRDEFLIEMYRQMFNDINRHIVVVWQSVTVLMSALALFALAEKNILPLDMASALALLICGWLYAHVIDAGYWYNRNLAIISNIERQFLRPSDQREIVYYFGSHRPTNKTLTHLRIQGALGIGLGLAVLIYHFITRVVPGFSATLDDFDPVRAIPYVAAVAALGYCNWFSAKRDSNYAEFLRESPGRRIDTSGVKYGSGHGFEDDAEGSETQGAQS